MRQEGKKKRKKEEKRESSAEQVMLQEREDSREKAEKGRQKERYYLVDSFRGFALVNMVLYHFLYDVFIIYGKNPGWLESIWTFVWQQGICWSFIGAAGFSWRFGRKNNLKRGLLLNFLGLAITGVTWFFMSEETIFFGILNFMGCAVLLTIPVSHILERIPPSAGLAGCMVLFYVFYPVSAGFLKAGPFLWQLPEKLYSGALTILGMPGPGFYSSDYFPVLPWIFLFWAGYFLYPLCTREGKLRSFFHLKVPGLAAIGRRTLWVYVLHQPVLMGICMLVM